MRQMMVMVGVIAGVVIGVTIGTVLMDRTRATDGSGVSIAVYWSPLDVNVSDPCVRSRQLGGDTPAATLNGFRDVVTIRDADDHIVSMTALDGATLDDDRCHMDITAVLDGAGHTVWLDDRYLASIPPGGLPDHASIVLEAWD